MFSETSLSFVFEYHVATIFECNFGYRDVINYFVVRFLCLFPIIVLAAHLWMCIGTMLVFFRIRHHKLSLLRNDNLIYYNSIFKFLLSRTANLIFPGLTFISVKLKSFIGFISPFIVLRSPFFWRNSSQQEWCRDVAPKFDEYYSHQTVPFSRKFETNDILSHVYKKENAVVHYRSAFNKGQFDQCIPIYNELNDRQLSTVIYTNKCIFKSLRFQKKNSAFDPKLFESDVGFSEAMQMNMMAIQKRIDRGLEESNQAKFLLNDLSLRFPFIRNKSRLTHQNLELLITRNNLDAINDINKLLIDYENSFSALGEALSISQFPLEGTLVVPRDGNLRCDLFLVKKPKKLLESVSKVDYSATLEDLRKFNVNRDITLLDGTVLSASSFHRPKVTREFLAQRIIGDKASVNSLPSGKNHKTLVEVNVFSSQIDEDQAIMEQGLSKDLTEYFSAKKLNSKIEVKVNLIEDLL